MSRDRLGVAFSDTEALGPKVVKLQKLIWAWNRRSWLLFWRRQDFLPQTWRARFSYEGPRGRNWFLLYFRGFFWTNKITLGLLGLMFIRHGSGDSNTLGTQLPYRRIMPHDALSGGSLNIPSMKLAPYQACSEWAFWWGGRVDVRPFQHGVT